MSMFRPLLLCLPLALTFACVVGCGGDGGGPAEMQEQPAYTEADASEDENYEKMQAENKARGYGS